MGYISKQFIDRLMDAVFIDEVIGDFVPLKRAGANLKGLSPFIEERSPSFMVSPVKKIWKDFASGKGGNVINFLMEKESCSYPEAIELLAKKYNMTVEYDDSEYAAQKMETVKKKETLRPVLQAVHELYKEAYRKLPENHPARIEVEQKRQYDHDVIVERGIGYAPGNFLYDILAKSNRLEQGMALGLIKKQDGRENLYDQYSERVIYPIFDGNGLIIGLAGRTVSERKTAKWINPDVSPTNVLYNKSKVWFGIDRARNEIRKKNEVWIVEGYNDVIALQNHGLLNTVAPCGTAITAMQINELKKICTKVVFCMDPDRAGIDSMLKHIPLFIGAGFRVETVLLPEDPDDFVRLYKPSIDLYGPLPKMMAEPEVRKDGFRMLLEHHLSGNELDRSAGAEKLCELIAKIEDKTIFEIYTGWLQKESKIKIATIKNWIKEYLIENIEVSDERYVQIELPDGIDVPLATLENDIRKYRMFMANNMIFMSIDAGDNKIRFVPKSNFMIEVLQHMVDEKFPMKLLRIKNIHGSEKIFDTLSENLNKPQSFENTVTGHGNFRWDGNMADLHRLKTYLFDHMGNGRKIDVLGWQPDGRFWAWSNKITTETGQDIPMDENGIFVKDNVHYYLPAANVIYKNNAFKFDAQKRFRVINNKLSFEAFAQKVLEVHRDHAISGILFAIASLFQDISVGKIGKFPILFLYGPGSTGKDELAEIIQSFLGLPQTAINLEGNASTIKASIRELAQFRNGISQYSEYKSGNPVHDGILKSFWDRRGYKRGNIESHVGTESVPIEASVVLTGNDYPREEPLIIRTIWNEMTKNQFNEEEMKCFDELKDIVANGVSGYSDGFIKYRNEYERDFDRMQRKWKGILQEQFPEAKSRIILNLSFLTATYDIFREKVTFPFSQDEMMNHFGKGIDQQIRKINAGSILNRFWEIFISSLRGQKEDRLQVNHIVKVEANLLYFNWTHTFAKIQRSWILQYREMAPGSSTVLEQLEKTGAIIDKLSRFSFDSGREANRTSAIVVNLNALGETVREDIVGSIMFQINQIDRETGQMNAFDSIPPATPGENKILDDDPEAPF